ncbi:MAG TPA: DUF1549 domain-containing protein [Bryobacteraceae bacterium]|nr:DUF1549 domain-containing protein [Bryobacteraceae bacterium]
MRSLLLFLILCVAATAGTRIVSLKTVPTEVTLNGSRASQQFVALATDEDGVEQDVTAKAEWKVSNPALASLSGAARVAAIANGRIKLSASFSGVKAQSSIVIEDAGSTRPISFSQEISAILTKRGCNGSACHGGVKGRGGLKLSGNALYPKDDYEWIVKGGVYQVLTNEVKGERVPRIDIKNPEKSMLLAKPTMTIAHGGGKRLEKESEDYQTMIQWIRSGAPYGEEGDQGPAKLTRLSIYPEMATLPVGGQRRLLVTGHYSNGKTEDLTHQVLYTANDGNVATVSADGIITAAQQGETTLLIRAAGQVASAGVGVIGPRIRSYPTISRANFIDDHVFEKLRKFQIIPSDLSEDSEFLRRVCLDLTGTLPPPNRVREFVASKDPKKREQVIDALLASPEFVDYWTYRFADIFRVAIFANGLTSKWSQGYWEWIRSNIETNRPYDEVARERISAQGYEPASRHFLPYNQIGPPGEVMAEEVRVFFGRRLDCAQCHNHPYENWSQDQFWGMAAFFSRLFKIGPVVIDHPTNMDLSSKDVNAKIELLHPRTKALVKPALLDHSPLQIAPDGNPRKALAAWMTAQPYFAEAAVNRIWGQFFSRGIVDPVDDFRSTNPPTHPELLSALAKDFRDHKYNLRHLMKTIVMSRTYQLSYKPNDTNRHDVVNYSRSLPRGLDADVLLDAVADVTGVPETFSTAVTEGSTVGQAPAGTRAVQLRDPDTFFSRFLELYGRANRGAIPDRATKPNLSQALHMLAGASYVDRLGQPKSRLARLLASGAADARIVEEFYVAALGRVPDPDGWKDVQDVLAKRGDREAALREFVWALISSREFSENH